MSIFKETIKPIISKQLTIRQNALLDRENNDVITYLNSRASWIRMSSSVDIRDESYLSRNFKTKGNLLSKKYILQGGTLFNNNGDQYALRRGIGSGGGAYGDINLGGPNSDFPKGGREELGIRPMPGITKINIKSKSAYGSLREATVDFFCSNMSQLEELELLYMRPGFSVLLEWGWSLFLNNNGKLVTDPPKYTNIIEQNLTKSQIFKDIDTKTDQSYGNYDAMFGRIINFSWKSRKDGGYDCQTKIISMGEVMDSLKINYSPATPKFFLSGINSSNFQQTDTSSNSKTQTKKEQIEDIYKNNKLLGLLVYFINKIPKIPTDDSGGGKYTIVTKENKKIIIPFVTYLLNFNQGSGNNTSSNSERQVYITMRSLVEIVNSFIIPSDKSKEPYIEISVDEDNGTPLECFSYYRQVSLNPKICLIKPCPDLVNSNLQMVKLKKLNSDFDYFLPIEGSNSIKEKYCRGNIGNILVNLNNVIDIIKQKISSSLSSEINLQDFFKTILDQIQTSTGNINKFDLHINNHGDKIRIIDVQYLETKSRKSPTSDTVVIEVFGLKSTARDYSISSNIFPAQSSVIAISAQLKSSALGYNNSSIVKFNEGLEDRVIKAIDDPNTNNSPIETEKNERNQAKDDFFKTRKNLINYFRSLNNNIVLTELIQELSTSFHDYITYEIAEANNNESKNSKYKGMLPISLNLSIDGIAGLIIGQIFTIPKDRLPLGYKDTGDFKVGFVIMGIEHELNGNDWVTNISTQTCILN